MWSEVGRDFQISLVFHLRDLFTLVNFHQCSLINTVFPASHIVKSQWHPNVLSLSSPFSHAAHGKDCDGQGCSPFVQSRSKACAQYFKAGEWVKRHVPARQNRDRGLLRDETGEQAAKKTFIRFVKLRQVPVSGFPVFHLAWLKNSSWYEYTNYHKGLGWEFTFILPVYKLDFLQRCNSHHLKGLGVSKGPM